MLTGKGVRVLEADNLREMIPVPTPDDDIALVRHAQRHADSFDALYYRYVDRVYAYVRARTTSQHDADDLTQQIFFHALRALRQYDPSRGSFAAWLFRIARNAVTDHYRRRRVTVPWDAMPPWQEPLSDDDPEEMALVGEDIIRLRSLLLTLDAEKRELLALRYAGGLSMAEIGAVVGKSEEATKKQIARCLRRLKERYGEV